MARHGFYEARLAGVVTERGAQVADGGLQHRFGDEPVTPNRVQQGVFRQQGVGLTRQRAQQAEGGGRERDGLAAAQQPRIRLIEFEVVETKADRIGDGERRARDMPCAMEEGIIAAAIPRRGCYFRCRWSGRPAVGSTSDPIAALHFGLRTACKRCSADTRWRIATPRVGAAATQAPPAAGHLHLKRAKRWPNVPTLPAVAEFTATG
jgi:hypothetical protein